MRRAASPGAGVLPPLLFLLHPRRPCPAACSVFHRVRISLGLGAPGQEQHQTGPPPPPPAAHSPSAPFRGVAVQVELDPQEGPHEGCLSPRPPATVAPTTLLRPLSSGFPLGAAGWEEGHRIPSALCRGAGSRGQPHSEGRASEDPGTPVKAEPGNPGMGEGGDGDEVPQQGKGSEPGPQLGLTSGAGVQQDWAGSGRASWRSRGPSTPGDPWGLGCQKQEGHGAGGPV